MASRPNPSSALNNNTSVTNVKDKSKTDTATTKSKHDKSAAAAASGAAAATVVHVPMSSNTILTTMNNMSQKRKGTSFQITSVSVSTGNATQANASATAQQNNGDESADDLDESQITDDNISRITDYETPSFSEDTFSREDVFFAQPNAFGTAPVIPTSSQYGLAIVGPGDLGGAGSNLGDVHVSVTDAGINIMGQMPNKQDVDHKNERFKVVKIESTEPFKRGRWMCMDYLDHTLQAQDDGTDGSAKESAPDSNSCGEEQQQQQNVVKTKDSGHESGLDDNNGDMDNDQLDQEVLRAEMNHIDASQHHEPMDLSGATTNTTISSQTNHTTHHGGTFDNSSTPMQHQQHELAHHAMTMTPDMIQRSIDQQQQQYHHLQGVTLPTNVILQNINPDQQFQQQLSTASSSVPQQSTTSSGSIVSPQPQSDELKATSTNNENVTSQFGDKINESDQAAAVDSEGMAQAASIGSTQSPSSSAGHGTVTDGNNGDASQAQAAAAGPENNDGQSMNEDSESASGTSAVAIDNKIEQAMDLVKSHLMFAVREEVEVLKEKIAELMDRINQLEVENTILKANASQETLSQLTTAAIVVSPLPPSVITAAVQQQLQNNASLALNPPANEQTTPAVTPNQQQQQQPSPMTQQQTNNGSNPPSQQTS